jgi:hypothetical protein
MSLNNFEYGRGAIVVPGRQDRFRSCVDKLIEDARPANFVEQLVTEEILHAQRELARCRDLAHELDHEGMLLAAENRAQRNFTRATRELTALQTARTAGYYRSDLAKKAPPLANAAKVPKRGRETSAVANAYCDFAYAETLRDEQELAGEQIP